MSKQSPFNDMTLTELQDEENAALQMMNDTDPNSFLYNISRTDLSTIRNIMKRKYGYDWMSKMRNAYLYSITIESDQGPITWHTTASGEEDAIKQFKGLAKSFLCPESAVDRSLKTLKQLKKVTND